MNATLHAQRTIDATQAIQAKKTGINIPLLRQVQAHILKEPFLFDMRAWRNTITEECLASFALSGIPRRQDIGKHGKCGTSYCIAGWAVTLSGSGRTPGFGSGKENLSLSEEQADELFHHDNWDYPWNEQYIQATTMTDAAQVACDYIDHFITRHTGDAQPCP